MHPTRSWGGLSKRDHTDIPEENDDNGLANEQISSGLTQPPDLTSTINLGLPSTSLFSSSSLTSSGSSVGATAGPAFKVVSIPELNMSKRISKGKKQLIWGNSFPLDNGPN